MRRYTEVFYCRYIKKIDIDYINSTKEYYWSKGARSLLKFEIWNGNEIQSCVLCVFHFFDLSSATTCVVSSHVEKIEYHKSSEAKRIRVIGSA